MSGESPPRPSLSANNQRRASIAPGTKLSEMFGGNAYSGSIAAAAANVSAHQRRRMSISTLGLSGSPNQTSPFNATRPRNESYSSRGTSPGTDNESAIDEGGDGTPTSPSPFLRRMSFGARAMRDARGNGPGSFNGEGFNWSDQIRSRAERSASITSPASTGHHSQPPSLPRANTVAAAEHVPKELPKQPKAPDHFQERILKGDFYMD